MRADYDDYDDYDDLESPGFRWMSIVVLFLAVGGFFSLAWYAYYTGTKSMNNEEVIVIQADTTPIKKKPEDRGGMEIPHQDKTIYEALSKQPGVVVEDVKLMPKVEKPVRPQIMELPVDNKKEGAEESPDDVLVAKREEEADPFKPEQKNVKEALDALFKDVRKEPVEKKITLAKEEKSPEEAPEPKRQESFNGYKVQLGAFKSEEEAQKNWNRISKKHNTILNGLPYRVIKADLGAKGVFYRLRVGGLANEGAAGVICEKLKNAGQGCFPAGT